MRGRESETLAQVSCLAARDLVLAAARRGGTTVEAPPDLGQALADAARVLDGGKASYALIGGLAVAIHTNHPRATLDVDLAVHSSADLPALLDAFRRAGFTLRGRFAHSVNLRHPSGGPVQLAVDPVFDAAIARAETFSLGKTSIRLVRREDLIDLKERAAADPRRRKSKALRDRADAEMLRGDVPDPEEGW